jgi:hypothetical protein
VSFGVFNLLGIVERGDCMVQLHADQHCFLRIDPRRRSGVLSSLISEVFIIIPVLFLYVIAPYNEFGGDGQLLRTEAECFLCNLIGYTFCFKDDPAGGYGYNKAFRGTFSLTHTNFGGLLGYGFIGEDPYPQLTFTFHMTCNCLTGCLYLPSGDPLLLKSLDTK